MTPNRRHLIAGASALTAEFMAFSAHAEPMPSRALMIIGDWGREGRHQGEVAQQMNRAAGELDCVGVVSVGDNIYEDGVQSVNDPKWRTLFEDVYNGDKLRPLPWYVALGNHDYGGNPQAQVDYTQHSDRWKMPARYFKVAGPRLGIPDLDLFIIDTNPLIPNNAIGDDPMAVNVRSQDSAAQLAWLDRELAASGAKFKIVAGHHTIFSGGSLHGNSQDLIDRLLPILKRHGVIAYVNGHDHDLQYIAREGMHFICSGGGSEARDVSPILGTRFCLSRPGFALISIGQAGLDLAFRDDTGVTCYRALLS